MLWYIRYVTVIICSCSIHLRINRLTYIHLYISIPIHTVPVWDAPQGSATFCHFYDLFPWNFPLTSMEVGGNRLRPIFHGS